MSPRCAAGAAAALADRVFAPLGWQVDARAQPFTPAEWGDSPYLDLRLTGEVRLADALNHLYVLLPVLDDAKHYWVSNDEVDKLIRAGGDWLAGHPDKELITRRYLSHSKRLTRSALARLAEADETEPDELDNAVPAEDEAAEADTRRPLAVQRREAILAVLHERGARRVGDLGCGAGALTRDLLADTRFEHVTAVDVSARALQLAARHLKLDQLPEPQAQAADDLPVLAHLPRRPAGRAGRRRADGGHRAPGPGPDPGARAGRVRRGRARHRRGHHPQRRVQRALRDPPGGRAAAPGPPVRVDPRRVPRLGRPGRGQATATGPGSCRSARRTRPTGPPTQLAVFEKEAA